MGFLLSLINPIKAITNAISNAYIAKQNATTDRERVKAETEIRTLEARRDVMIAEARTPVNQIVRALLAGPVVFILWKVLVYDKAFDTSTIMSENLWHVVWIVLGFYFIDATATRMTRMLKR